MHYKGLCFGKVAYGQHPVKKEGVRMDTSFFNHILVFFK